MKMKNLAALALSALSAAVLMGATCGADNHATVPMHKEQMSPQAQAFYNSLSADAKKKFDELDPARREKAFQMGGDVNKAVDAQYQEMKGTPAAH